MKRILFSFVVLGSLSSAAGAEPVSLVSRSAADTYVDHGTGVTVATVGCTQTARVMDVRLERSERTGRLWLVFLDSDGREEGDCEVRALLLSKPRSAGVAR